MDRQKIKINEIHDTPINPNIVKSVRKIIENEGYLECEANIKVIKPNGGVLMSVFHEVDVVGKTVNGDDTLNLFIKMILPNQQLTIYNSADSFVKEAYVYNELLDILANVQDEAKVPMEERLTTAKGYNETNNEYIVMENLNKRGFITIDKSEIVSYEYAAASMKVLAKFHALSLVLKEKRPDYFNEKIVKLKQPFYYGTEAWNGFVGNTSRLAAFCLDDDAKDRIEKYIPKTFEKYAKYAEDPNMVRCIVHGDFRPANVMVKIENGEVKQLTPIDFQLCFYGCPIIDFLYYIFSSTDQEFRKNHLESLKDVYHETMTIFLKHFNMDVEKYFPRDEFEKMFREKLDYGLMVSLWYTPFALADDGTIGDVTNMDLTTMKIEFNDATKTRIRGIVDDFIQWGYI